MYFNIETSLDCTDSHYDTDYCAQVHVEYEVETSYCREKGRYLIDSIKIVSVCEIPPKHEESSPVHFYTLDKIDPQDMKWLIRKCEQDASEQDIDSEMDDAKADEAYDYWREENR